MRRRKFITLLGGTAAAWSIAAFAQQPAMPVVGFLHSGSPGQFTESLTAFRQGLSDLGYVVGQNVTIEYYWAYGQFENLPVLAADLVQRHPAVIFAGGNIDSTLAVKAMTSTTPIVFSSGFDPITVGLVSSLNRPGGNITGMHLFFTRTNQKNLELLHELVPNATTIAVLQSHNSINGAPAMKLIEDAARSLGLTLKVLNARSPREFEEAFFTLDQMGVGAVLVRDDAAFTNQRDTIVALATRYAVPTTYFLRDFVAAGGLMSYGSSLTGAYRQLGVYVGRILKGEKPADLPVMQPTKFELVINLKTAKALGLDVPPKLLALADEEIE
jgi:putative ABC transport system substrate-binding protein